jgi:CRP/FNR family cyclic AMP-dependent transcriptional regulator
MMFRELNEQEMEMIRARGELIRYRPGERIFAEGEEADYIYLIHGGRISVFIEKFNSREQVQSLGKGEWLGEMALFHHNRRTACAEAVDTSDLLRVRKKAFLQLLSADSSLKRKIDAGLALRSEELVAREKLIDLNASDGALRHIAIKGDPSLRYSALTRERYESIVDRLLPELIGVFKALLLERSAYSLFVGFNSGEVHVSTVFDPFGQEYHPAGRLLDPAYLERHFPRMEYREKAQMMRGVYEAMAASSAFTRLPHYLQRGYTKYFSDWSPVSAETLAATIDSLPQLRAIPYFYVRNASIGVAKDAIHLQFNCDGGHILSAGSYQRFLKENL